MVSKYKSIYVNLRNGNKYYLDKPLGAPSAQIKYTQDIASNTWIIQHNLNSNKFVIEVTDSLNPIIPDQVIITDLNTVTITFSSNVSGIALLLFFGDMEIPTITQTPTPTVTPTPSPIASSPLI